MKEPKYSLTEVVEKINNKLHEDFNGDECSTKAITERNFRKYVSDNLIKKPVKEGKNAYYNENHVSDVINIRKMQSKGLPLSIIKAVGVSGYNQTKPEEDDDVFLRNQAMSILAKINKETETTCSIKNTKKIHNISMGSLQGSNISKENSVTASKSYSYQFENSQLYVEGKELDDTQIIAIKSILSQ